MARRHSTSWLAPTLGTFAILAVMIGQLAHCDQSERCKKILADESASNKLTSLVTEAIFDLEHVKPMDSSLVVKGLVKQATSQGLFGSRDYRSDQEKFSTLIKILEDRAQCQDELKAGLGDGTRLKIKFMTDHLDNLKAESLKRSKLTQQLLQEQIAILTQSMGNLASKFKFAKE